MAGLVPAIHALLAEGKAWMPGTRPGMTEWKIMSAANNLRSVAPAAVKAMLGDGGELALIDLREELIFSRNHLLWARNVPLSRLELRFARLVPRRATRIVLIDDNNGLAQRATDILAGAGYTDLSTLDGGIAAWAAAGFELFSGVHVPSKAFGEFIEHSSHTPSIRSEEHTSE